MYHHDTYTSNNSSGSGSEHSSDVGADLPRSNSLKNSIASKKTLISPFSSATSPDASSPNLVLQNIEIPPEINDPKLFRPVAGHVKPEIVWRYCTIRGWLTKHIPPSYSFTKTRKVRYILLADRMLYAFKSDQPTSQYREFFELTKDTDVFVTDHFHGVLYCIQVIKRHLETKCWFLECADAEDMKIWLERLKKTVGWLKENDNNDGIVNVSKFDPLYQNEHDPIAAGALAPAPAAGALTTRNISYSSSSSDDISSVQESFYSTSTGLVSPRTPPLLTDQSYYQNMTMTPSASHHQHQHEYHLTHPRHHQHLLSPPTPPSHPLSQPSESLSYTNAYVKDWETSHQQRHPQRQQSQQHPSCYSSRRAPSAPHVLPPQRPPPRTAPPPPPTSAAALHYQQYQQKPPRHYTYL